MGVGTASRTKITLADKTSEAFGAPEVCGCIIRIMKTMSGKNTLRSILTITTKAILALTALTVSVGFIEVNNALHPPRIIPPGNTLRKYKIPYQSLDLITADGIRLSAWYTPPRNDVVILLAHGYGDNRPEWVHALLAKKGYGVISWDARARRKRWGDLDNRLS